MPIVMSYWKLFASFCAIVYPHLCENIAGESCPGCCYFIEHVLRGPVAHGRMSAPELLLIGLRGTPVDAAARFHKEFLLFCFETLVGRSAVR
jgi:hypothetical protein